MKLCWKGLQRPVVSAQQNKKRRRARTTSSIVPNLIDFFNDDWKEIKMQTEKINALAICISS